MNEFSISNIPLTNQSYFKLKFDISKIKSINKIYENYHINRDENIIAYIKSSVIVFPLSADGTIITDKAVYHHPSHDDWSYNNRVPFSDLCRYIFVMYDERSALILVNSEEEHTMVGNTLFGKNKGGIDLYLFLKYIQDYMTNTYDWAKNQHNSEISKILEKARNLIRTGNLSENIEYAVKLITTYENFSDKAILLEAEYLYRQCDTDNFNEYVNSLGNINTQQLIKNNLAVLKKSFLDDLGDYKLIINFDFLTSARKNILNRTTMQNDDYIILTYINIRLRDNVAYNSYLNKLNDKSLIRKYHFFIGSYYNYQMKQVYDSIKHGNLPSEECLSWSDSLGLTPLHYAIIFHEEGLIEDILHSKKLNLNCCLDKSDEAYKLYDYNVLAAYFNIRDKKQICLNTSPEIYSKYSTYNSMCQEYESMKRERDLLNQRKNMLYRKYSEASRNGWSEERNRIDSELYDVEHTLFSIMDDISDIYKESVLLKNEIDSEIEKTLQSASDTATGLNNTNNIYAKFLLDLYDNPDFLYHIISDESDKKLLYLYSGFMFVTPSDVIIKLYYYDDLYGDKKINFTQSEEKTKFGKKPYGNSWFSPEAHKDIKMLKLEYAELAKRFHPDTSRTSETVKYFKEITLERNFIKENLT